jgi:hypothetical protein
MFGAAVKLPPQQIHPGVPYSGRTRFEHSPKSSGNMGFSEIGGTKSGTLGAQFGDFPPDLVTVINAWSKLPEEVQQKIVAIVTKHQSESEEKTTPS